MTRRSALSAIAGALATAAAPLDVPIQHQEPRNLTMDQFKRYAESGNLHDGDRVAMRFMVEVDLDLANSVRGVDSRGQLGRYATEVVLHVRIDYDPESCKWTATETFNDVSDPVLVDRRA